MGRRSGIGGRGSGPSSTPVVSAFRRNPEVRSRTCVESSCALAVAALAVATLKGQPEAGSRKLEAGDELWVAATLKKMTLDDKVGQLLVSSFASEYMSTDSREFDELVKSIHDYRIGGFHVFGGAEPAPDVLLDANYGTRHTRPAAGGGVAAQSPAGDRDVSAAELRRLRDRRRLPPRRRDGVSPQHGVWRRRRREAGLRGGAHHRASNRARSASR